MDALADLVNRHFMFLKVGPESTFRLREAVFALTKIHTELMRSSEGDFLGICRNKMVIIQNIGKLITLVQNRTSGT